MNTLSDADVDNLALVACHQLSLKFDRFLGSGAFKRTYRVVDSNKFPVALKISRRFGAGDERSKREIDSMNLLKTANFAKLHLTSALKTPNGTVGIIIEELMEGGTLSQRAKMAQFSAASLRNIAYNLSIGVVQLHNQRLVHRDIKPDNVMFRDNGEFPVIVDFGLVRVLDASSITQTWIPTGPGTPLFASPEQLLNEKTIIDWRADQFAVATTIYFTATGRHPYQLAGDSVVDAINRVARREYPTQDFAQFCNLNNLRPLVKMCQPWPVQRFCSDQHLEGAWN